MIRRDVLEKAITCVCNGRELEYGTPEDNFSLIARFWDLYLDGRQPNAHDVAIMMALMKIARIATGVQKEDSYVDAAGYIACAYEVGGVK